MITGLFYKKRLSESDKDQMVWNLIEYALAEAALSRVNRKKTKNAVGNTEDDTEISSAKSSSLEKPSSSKLPVAQCPDLSQSSASGKEKAHEDDKTENRSTEAITTQIDGMSVSFQDQEEPNISVLPFTTELPPTNAERIIMECTSRTPDYDFRFWKCHLIERVRQAKDSTKEFVKQTAKDRLINADTAKEDSKVWLASVSVNSFSQDAITYQEFDEKAAASFDRAEHYLDNIDFQLEDLEDACKRMGID